MGDRLAQLELHPTVIVDRSQVMLLDPASDGDGRAGAHAPGVPSRLD